MRYRSLATVAMSVLAVFVAPSVTAHAEPCPIGRSPAPAPETTAFYHGNKAFGPEQLPTDGPVGKLLGRNYDRFGGMGEPDWTRTFYDRNNIYYWRWPPISAGFDTAAGPPLGKPSEKNRNLNPGQLVDRFGYENGKYLSPLGAIPIPFGWRALPPEALNTPAGAPQSNYHVYCVLQQFAVDAGPIYPWFAQHGEGTQLFLNADYLPGKPEKPTVQWLIDNNFLREVMPQ